MTTHRSKPMTHRHIISLLMFSALSCLSTGCGTQEYEKPKPSSTPEASGTAPTTPAGDTSVAKEVKKTITENLPPDSNNPSQSMAAPQGDKARYYIQKGTQAIQALVGKAGDLAIDQINYANENPKAAIVATAISVPLGIYLYLKTRNGWRWIRSRLPFGPRRPGGGPGGGSGAGDDTHGSGGLTITIKVSPCSGQVAKLAQTTPPAH